MTKLLLIVMLLLSGCAVVNHDTCFVTQQGSLAQKDGKVVVHTTLVEVMCPPYAPVKDILGDSYEPAIRK